MPAHASEAGAGYIFQGPDGPQIALLPGPELLAQTEMMRGTDFLRHGDRLLCGAPVASAAGTIIGLWAPLLRGLPCLPVPRGLSTAELRQVLNRQEGNCALGGGLFSRQLAAACVGTPFSLRSYILCDCVPGSAPTVDTLVCPCLADDAAAAVLTVSMQDPPLITTTSEPQAGHREGSRGRLLPGVRAVVAGDGTLHCTLAFGRTVVLPAGSRVDDAGFVFLPAE
jgi:hypothetical protein